MMTLSLLADSVRDDSALSAESRQRMDLVMQEMFRIIDIIADSVPADAPSVPPVAVDLRELANDVARLARLAYDTTVPVEPGEPVCVAVGASVMWRVLANIVDNSVRGAGPGGHVGIRIESGPETILEVTDDGAGFGSGPPGWAGLGLSVVRQLLDSEGGHLEIGDVTGGGARVRLIFGPERDPLRRDDTGTSS
jgi:signal transduction histidine kinase